ncbi:MAG: hypothetical protein M3Z37_10230 [Candidatus Eremiobacteraeota bacterium]|nr:hypothetical protein [Candidatus Eremiobacteraeota bacterium]
MATLRFRRLGPLSLLVAACAALAACSGGGVGFGGVTRQVCNTGTQTQLASPLSGQTGVSPTTGQIIIVANGNNNQLYNTRSQWSLTLVDNLGGVINGGQLQLVPFPSGPHPYQSDFYYGSSVSLVPARTYSVSLGLPGGSCSSIALGVFST